MGGVAVAGSQPMSTAQINFGDLTPMTYLKERDTKRMCRFQQAGRGVLSASAPTVVQPARFLARSSSSKQRRHLQSTL